MPYIKDNREALSFLDKNPMTPGELNFVITSVLKRYLNEKGLSYQTINDILGALEGSKLEFYRRIAVDYENKKIDQNGDVY